MVKKILLVLTLLALMPVFLGWLPKERVNRLVWLMAGLFVVGFCWRFLSWYLSL